MTPLSPLPENGLYGIVIYNFRHKHDGVPMLDVNVGAALHLLSESEGWYEAAIIPQFHERGFIPKSYVHVVQDCHIEQDGPTPTFIFPGQPTIVHEITLVLREWSSLYKNLYITNREEFDKLKKHILDLINYRSKIISGTLPVDELKEVTREATKVIALGNKICQLDLVVRDSNGTTINPEETSTIDLHSYHQNATELLNSKTDPKDTKSSISSHYSHIFVVSVQNFTYKMTEDAELLMFLYDCKEGRAITENYVVQWSKEGLMADLDKINNLKVMFTDLGKKDLEREKVYLVCNVIRVGSMEVKEVDHRRSSTVTSSITPKKPSWIPIRRPCGVAAKDITSYISSSQQSDLDKDFPVPFYNCEKDNLEQTLKRIISKDDNKGEHKSSLYIGVKLLHGDIKQVRDENPHLVLGNVNIARKMGFPEVILPGDIRNDLYLTLMHGEFPKGNKSSDKNIEVKVTVCNEDGVDIPGVIFIGDSKNPLNSYHSVVYYHDAKPQWYETFKVAMPIEEFKKSHIKFTFKHRSSNEAKDKSEKPFAFAYVNLMQKNGTTLKDDKHNLLVYKYDYKKFDEKDSNNYLKLASTKDEDPGKNPSINGLSLSTKDWFMISSNVCSTKLTQNVHLLALLNWITSKNAIKDILINLMKVEGEEIVKFLPDILDTLFYILMDEQTPATYDSIVFDCLLYITGIVSSDWRYQHFEPVLNMYIKENFCATLAYEKMLKVLCNLISNTEVGNDMKLFRTMKSFQYIMRFITQSRLLHCSMKLSDDDQAEATFNECMDDLFNAFIDLMSHPHDHLLREQGACLKYLPGAIPDILTVYNAEDLSYKLSDLFHKMPSNRLKKQKVMTMNEIVLGPLFKDAQCRAILLSKILRQLQPLMEEDQEDTNNAGSQTGRRIKPKSVAKVALVLGISKQSITEHTSSTSTDEVINVLSQMELCMNTLGDILTLLFRIDQSESYESINSIIFILLRTISQCYIKSDKEQPQAKQLAAMLIDLFRQMSENHYNDYLSSDLFETPMDKLSFIIEIMTIFKEFVDSNQKIFPEDWCEMKMLQNHVILKALRFFSHTIRDEFSANFNYQAWSNFFQCAISYMAQPALQLHTFSANKKRRISKRYGDMRREMGFEVRQMWFNLGQHKRRFVPGLIENILEMTLIPENELRKATIPIFFDMMQCEFYSSSKAFESFGDTLRNSNHVKGNFNEFEREMIIKLDTFFEGGRGDETYKIMFHNIMIDLCKDHERLAVPGTKFVKTLTSLMDRLLLYRITMDNENIENKMMCIVNLLDFYSEILRKEMYIRYVYKLYNLHIELGNNTEAAFTLELHSKLLEWSNKTLQPQLKSSKFEKATTHMELKELLCKAIIENYNKGQMWEFAIQGTKELIEQYEHLYFFDLVSPLHRNMASYYQSIMTQTRGANGYFRVDYYGQGFPKFLRNKSFVYRGSGFERLHDFTNRILREFPKAEQYHDQSLPDESITESSGQYIKIIHVEPIQKETNRFEGQLVSDQIESFYKWNDVNRFQHSRMVIRNDPLIDTPNEFCKTWNERTIITTTHAFPHILCWYPVKSDETEVISLTPLQVAIETMERSNQELRIYYKRFAEDLVTSSQLSLRLQGILEPAVNGGIANYEQFFFTPEYINAHPEEVDNINRLKDLIAEQLPLLELGVDMHRKLVGDNSSGLQQRFEDCLYTRRAAVHSKYGVKDCNDFKTEVEVRLRKIEKEPMHHNHHSQPADFNLGNRSRVSSITRAQVQSFKNLTSSFNFSASSASQSELNIFSKPTLSSTKSLLLSPTRSMSSTPGTLKKNKNKEKRRASKTESTLSTSSITTQWYTADVENSITAANIPSNGTPIFELRQELTPKRPLRSEVEKEKRLSRPSSGQFSRPSSLSITLRATSSSGTSSNRDSIGTTDSSVSEEDLPPPLPVKLRELDCSNISIRESSMTPVFSIINNHPLNYDMAPLLNEKVSCKDNKDSKPPTPPPKPPKKKNQTCSLLVTPPS